MPDIRYDYIVIGCEAAGVGLVRELKAAGKNVLAVDKSPERIELLESEGLDAILADPLDASLYKSINLNVSAVIIAGTDDETNLAVVKTIRSVSRDVFIIARVSSQKLKDDFEAAGANLVVLVPDAVRQFVIDRVKKMELFKKIESLKKIFELVKGRKIAIFTHDNPDPDSISSAFALREIAKQFDVQADILYYGEILHQRNRAMVNLLEIPMKRASEANLSDYAAFALVDSSGPGVNNSIPPELEIKIVIDHHPAEKVDAEFADIRTDAGATATILTEYLKELKILPSKTLATALFFGIKSETDEFKRNTRTADFLASAFLYPFVDPDLIEKIEGPAISNETLDTIGTAIKNRQVYSSFLISFAGFINDRDALPQAADFLLKLEGVSTVVVFGVVKETVFVSGRNKDVRIHMGDVLKRAFADVGSAGGHAHAAGAQIPLGIFGEVTDRELLSKLITEAIKKRLLSAVGLEQTKFEQS